MLLSFDSSIGKVIPYGTTISMPFWRSGTMNSREEMAILSKSMESKAHELDVPSIPSSIVAVSKRNRDGSVSIILPHEVFQLYRNKLEHKVVSKNGLRHLKYMPWMEQHMKGTIDAKHYGLDLPVGAFYCDNVKAEGRNGFAVYGPNYDGKKGMVAIETYDADDGKPYTYDLKIEVSIKTAILLGNALPEDVPDCIIKDLFNLME